jgi:hypothetical protein
MVEKEEQVKTGIKTGALKEGGYICVDKLMNRICAPKPGNCEVHSIILWTKESADDKVKTWDKVVRPTPTSDSNDIKSGTYINIVWRCGLWPGQTGQQVFH